MTHAASASGELERFGYVGTLDTDILFQVDPFDAWHPHVQGKHELLLSAENPVDDNEGGQALAKLGIVRRLPKDDGFRWAWEAAPSSGAINPKRPIRAPAAPPAPDCRYTYEVPPSPLHPTGVHRQPQIQADYWRLFGQTERPNFGTLLGTRPALLHLLETCPARHLPRKEPLRAQRRTPARPSPAHRLGDYAGL